MKPPVSKAKRTVASLGHPTEPDCSEQGRIRDEKSPIAGAQSVSRALSILDMFTMEHRTITGPEVAEHFGYSVPTAHRLLRALEAQRFVVFDRSNHNYSLGPELVRLSTVVVGRDELARLTTDVLIRLNRETGEAAGFHWMMGAVRTCLQEVNSTTATGSRNGRTYPLARGAASKAILLAMPREQMTTLLGDEDLSVAGEVDEARSRGYATSVAENEPGIASVAVPFVWLEHSVGAFSLSGPRTRMPDQRLHDLGALLLAHARRVTAEVELRHRLR